MNYTSFQSSRIGAAHVRKNLPRQDRAAAKSDGNMHIIAVADGHGNRRHFRSETGAEFAVQTALEQIEAAIRQEGASILKEEFYDRLMKSIITEWQKSVRDHFDQTPLTDQEMEEQSGILTDEQLDRVMSGEDSLIPYGSTLCAAFVTQEGWGGIQIGDGCITAVNEKGEYTWPLPESKVNQGNKTASLCMKDPSVDFRFYCAAEHPAAILVYTDGIEKNFPPEGMEIVSFLHWVILNERKQSENRAETLERNLDMLTQRSRIGDDISIAGMVDLDQADSAPKPTLRMMTDRLDQVDAKIQECEHTIRFNLTRKVTIRESDEAYEQFVNLLSRKKDEIRALLTQRQKILEQMKEFGFDADIISARELRGDPEEYIEKVFREPERPVEAKKQDDPKEIPKQTETPIKIGQSDDDQGEIAAEEQASVPPVMEPVEEEKPWLQEDIFKDPLWGMPLSGFNGFDYYDEWFYLMFPGDVIRNMNARRRRWIESSVKDNANPLRNSKKDKSNGI